MTCSRSSRPSPEVAENTCTVANPPHGFHALAVTELIGLGQHHVQRQPAVKRELGKLDVAVLERVADIHDLDQSGERSPRFQVALDQALPVLAKIDADLGVA